MQINWFPGHMKRTLESLERETKNIDLVLYVLDGRAFLSTLNPKIDDIVKNKSILYVINKADLIEEKDSKRILKYFSDRQKNAICVTGTEKTASKQLFAAIKSIFKEKIEKSKIKGIDPVFKIMVIGTPNTGKSSIINTLYGQKKAVTGDKAGVTKQNQWVKIENNFVLLDTPGTLWPKMDDDEVKLKLAFIGGIKKDVVDDSELGFQLIKYLVKTYPECLKTRYNVDGFERETIEIYDDILKRLGCLMRGAELDYDRGGTKVLEDFRSGRMGKICLD